MTMNFLRGRPGYKKGQATDILMYGVLIFVMAVTILIGYRVLTDINAQIQDADTVPQVAKDGIGGFTNRYATIFDIGYGFVIFLLVIGLIGSVFLIDTNPLFFALTLPAFMAVLMVNAILANTLDDLGSNAQLTVLYAQFPVMNFVAAHWLGIMTIVGFTTFIIFFGKRQT